MMADKKPLWEVMQSAYLAGCKPGFTDCHGYAAELRALADEVVPEHLCDACDEWDHRAIACDVIRQRLLDAANEAEGGSDG
jgi:hypothetical protein